MPSQLLTVNAAYRRALGAQEAQAVAQLSHAYAVAWNALAANVDALAASVADEANPSPAELFRLERYKALQADLADVMAQLVPHAQQLILQQQAAALRIGSDAALLQIQAALGPEAAEALQLARVPDAQLRELLGFLAPGSPLADNLNALGDLAAAQVKDGLLRGVTLGIGPRQIASSIKDAFGGNLVSALRYSRTAQLYSARGALFEHYKANNDVVDGWVWTAACDATCCAVCWSLHGSEHTLDEFMEAHWGCRCGPSPKTRGSRVDFADGESLFADADEATQRAVLGQAGYRAFQAGDLQLTDLLGRRDDATLGTVYARRSLVDVVGKQDATQYYSQAAD